MGFSQCVEFVLNGRYFALPLENVKEIIAKPEITPLPMASKHVKGMINLRGDVIPIVDLDVCLGGASKDKERSDIVIIDIDGLNAGILVDYASQVTELDLSDIRSENLDDDLGVNKSSVLGVVKDGEKLVVVLDALQILSIDREILEGIGREKRQNQEEKTSTDSVRIVTFDLAGDVYGFKLEEVREILKFSEPVEVPDSPPFVKGVLQIRGAILPIVSLKERLNKKSELKAEKAKILIADYGSYRIGFIADSIKEVLEVPLSHVSEPPSIIKSGRDKESVEAIVHYDDNIVTILNKDGLVDHERLKDMASGEDESSQIDKLRSDSETFVVFEIGDQPFGLPITQIREINRIGSLSDMPGTPDFVDGVLNIRGDVIPAVNMKTRLGIDSISERDEDTGRVLVVELGDSLVGFMVDDVTGVAEITKDKITEPPKSMAELDSARKFVSQIARTSDDGKMLLVLEPRSVISPDELKSFLR